MQTATLETTTVGERLQTDAAELSEVAQLGNAERQRRDHQRDDEHEEQP
jgi:hypothetical protein